jgi:molybdopterin synthase sulfur carrier subunit
MITLRYFARLKEALGCAQEQAELPHTVNDVASLMAWLRLRGGVWENELVSGKALRVAVNQTMARMDAVVKDGDEIAIFPPVTGG